MQEADEVVQNANRAIENVKKRICELKTGKNQVHLVFLAGLVIKTLSENHLLVQFLKDVVRSDVLAEVLPSVMNALKSVKGLAIGTSKQGMSIVANVGARTCPKMVPRFGEGTAKKVGPHLTAKGAKRMGAKAGKKVGTKAATKTAAKQAGTVIIGVSAAFLVLDVMDLAFIVRDIVENKGSHAACILRYKADEYEALLNKK